MKHFKTLATAVLAVTLASGEAVACQCIGTPIVHANGGGTICSEAVSYMKMTGYPYPPDSVYIGRDSCVYGPSPVIRGNARIIRSKVSGKFAEVFGNATIVNSVVSNEGQVGGNARVVNSTVMGFSQVSGNAKVLDSSVIGLYARIYGNAVVRGGSYIQGGAEVYGSAVVANGSRILRGGKVNCGRWVNITVTTDRTGECGRNGRVLSVGSDGSGDVQTSDPISPGNTESEI